MSERTVTARWDGGLRAVVDAGGFEIVVDEPESVGGTGRGPQPTELLLASAASCMTIALAYVAGRKGVELAGLHVEVTGTYDGPQFSDLRILVHAAQPTGPELDTLIHAAERVCYVTRTLRSGPGVTVEQGAVEQGPVGGQGPIEQDPAGDLAQG